MFFTPDKIPSLSARIRKISTKVLMAEEFLFFTSNLRERIWLYSIYWWLNHLSNPALFSVPPKRVFAHLSTRKAPHANTNLRNPFFSNSRIINDRSLSADFTISRVHLGDGCCCSMLYFAVSRAGLVSCCYEKPVITGRLAKTVRQQ